MILTIVAGFYRERRSLEKIYELRGSDVYSRDVSVDPGRLRQAQFTDDLRPELQRARGLLPTVERDFRPRVVSRVVHGVLTCQDPSEL